MQYEITPAQLSHFRKKGEITFEALFDDSVRKAISHFRQGEDLFRTEEKIRSVVLNTSVGKLIFELLGKKPIRLLHDAIVQNQTLDLSHLCFQGVLIGALFPFSDNVITFFSVDHPIEVTEPALLAVYGENNARYVLHEQDPNSSRLKKLGYAYGDRLKIEDFPYVHR